MAESIETFIQIENTQYQNQSQDSQQRMTPSLGKLYMWMDIWITQIMDQKKQENKIIGNYDWTVH